MIKRRFNYGHYAVAIILVGLVHLGCGSESDDSDSTNRSGGTAVSNSMGRCDLDCTGSSGGPPTDGCLIVDQMEACVMTCSTDGDCEAPFWGPCTAQSDDGTSICADSPPPSP